MRKRSDGRSPSQGPFQVGQGQPAVSPVNPESQGPQRPSDPEADGPRQKPDEEGEETGEPNSIKSIYLIFFVGISPSAPHSEKPARSRQSRVQCPKPDFEDIDGGGPQLPSRAAILTASFAVVIRASAPCL